MYQILVFCETVPQQIPLLGLPFIPGEKTGTQVLQFDENQERTTLPSTTSDLQRARVKRKRVCKSKA